MLKTKVTHALLEHRGEPNLGQCIEQREFQYVRQAHTATLQTHSKARKPRSVVYERAEIQGVSVKHEVRRNALPHTQPLPGTGKQDGIHAESDGAIDTRILPVGLQHVTHLGAAQSR